MKAAPLSKKQEKSLCLLIVHSLIAVVLKLSIAKQKVSLAVGVIIGNTIALQRLFGDIRADCLKYKKI